MAGILDVHVHYAAGLPSLCDYGEQDVYVRFLFGELDPLSGAVLQTRTVRKGGTRPIFDQSLQVGVPSGEQRLRCEVFMSQPRGRDQLLGAANVSLEEIISRTAKLSKKPAEFKLLSSSSAPAGALVLTLTYHGRSASSSRPAAQPAAHPSAQFGAQSAAQTDGQAGAAAAGGAFARLAFPPSLQDSAAATSAAAAATSAAAAAIALLPAKRTPPPLPASFAMAAPPPNSGSLPASSAAAGASAPSPSFFNPSPSLVSHPSPSLVSHAPPSLSHPSAPAAPLLFNHLASSAAAPSSQRWGATEGASQLESRRVVTGTEVENRAGGDFTSANGAGQGALRGIPSAEFSLGGARIGGAGVGGAGAGGAGGTAGVAGAAAELMTMAQNDSTHRSYLARQLLDSSAAMQGGASMGPLDLGPSNGGDASMGAVDLPGASLGAVAAGSAEPVKAEQAGGVLGELGGGRMGGTGKTSPPPCLDLSAGLGRAGGAEGGIGGRRKSLRREREWWSEAKAEAMEVEGGSEGFGGRSGVGGVELGLSTVAAAAAAATEAGGNESAAEGSKSAAAAEPRAEAGAERSTEPIADLLNVNHAHRQNEQQQQQQQEEEEEEEEEEPRLMQLLPMQWCSEDREKDSFMHSRSSNRPSGPLDRPSSGLTPSGGTPATVASPDLSLGRATKLSLEPAEPSRHGLASSLTLGLEPEPVGEPGRAPVPCHPAPFSMSMGSSFQPIQQAPHQGAAEKPASLLPSLPSFSCRSRSTAACPAAAAARSLFGALMASEHATEDVRMGEAACSAQLTCLPFTVHI
ncbi:unnamed protein product [Closterium sp. Naga37s-1]|nr:unnamed protein product [Closterium sp. Naga37s-1]